MASVPFNNLITFSRGSNATLTGPNGLIQWAPNNLLTNSESFNASIWAKFDASVGANTTIAPDGTTTADTLTENTANAAHYLSVTPSTSAGSHTLSLFYKIPSARKLALYHSNTNTGRQFDASGNQSAGLFVAPAGGATVTSFGNGWYRATITVTTTAATQEFRFWMVRASDDAISYTGDGVSGVFLWGAELELGTAATTYNSTTVKNLLGFSEAFDNAAWTKSNASIVTGAQANPVNGAFNAQKLMENATANIHFASQSITALSPANNSYMVSAYVKAGGRNYVTLGLSDISVGSRYAVAVFNLNTGATMTTGAQGTGYAVSNATAVAVGNGWYRCSVYCTAGTTVSFLAAAIGVNQSGVITGTTAGGFESYTGDGSSGVYIYGAQLSDSASLDPYVPTPGAAPSSTAYYGPRFDYDPVTLQPKGILVEEARTNLATYSEQFDNAAWTKSSSSVSANATIAPDGTLTADKLQVLDALNTQKFVNQTIGAISTTYADTVYAKASELSWLIINQYDGSDRRTWFNLSNGTVGTTAAGTTASIEAMPNGWYRCRAVRTVGTGSIQLVLNVTNADNVAVFVGTVGQGIFIWGAQREAGAFATSYIPTVASTVTRSADVATITGSLLNQWYGQSEGTWIGDWSTSNPVSNKRVIGTTSSFDIGPLVLSSTNAMASWSGSFNLVTAAGPNNGGPVKAALGYSGAGRSLVYAGGATATDANTIPTVAGVNFGKGFDTTQYLNGHIRSIQYYPVRLADFQLQALSA
jgi:hypothetical protein